MRVRVGAVAADVLARRIVSPFSSGTVGDTARREVEGTRRAASRSDGIGASEERLRAGRARSIAEVVPAGDATRDAKSAVRTEDFARPANASRLVSVKRESSRARQAGPLHEVAAFDLEAALIIERGAIVKDGRRSFRRVGSGEADKPAGVDTSDGLCGRGGGGKRRQDEFAQHACVETVM